MNDNLNVEKYTIYKFYKEQYKNDLFVVNRRYQRKLVWTLEEKQSLVDSIFRGYPIPIFFMSSYSDGEGKKFEIIDGLQRIEAIASFISGCFQVSYNGFTGYFSLDAFTGYGKKIADGIIVQKEPVLPLDICEKFLDYELAYSITGMDDSEIEEIFRRINSKGRKLSKQDLRQAGITGNFSDLVRKTAAYLRGDYSSNDIIKLTRMPEYSLNNKNLSYGIDVKTVFWIENGIIQEDGLRRSKDEEIIAHIYSYLIAGGKYSSSSKTLDNLYFMNSKIKQDLDLRIKDSGGIMYWMTIFSKTVSILNDVFLKHPFAKWLFKNKYVYNKDYCFIVLFCAVAELILENKELNSKEKFVDALHCLGDTQLSELCNKSNSTWNKELRNLLIERTKNVLQNLFDQKVNCHEVRLSGDIYLIDFLDRVSSESQSCDFKAGITNFKTGKLNTACISKIVKTLAAMCNTKPNTDVFILVGVPDTKESALELAKILDTNLIKCKNYDVLGIDAEAKRYYNSVDQYTTLIAEYVKKEPVGDVFKHRILSESTLVEYKGKTLYLFRCKSEEPVFYDGELFIRHNSSTELVQNGSSVFLDIMKSFYRNCES